MSTKQNPASSFPLMWQMYLRRKRQNMRSKVVVNINGAIRAVNMSVGNFAWEIAQENDKVSSKKAEVG